MLSSPLAQSTALLRRIGTFPEQRSLKVPIKVVSQWQHRLMHLKRRRIWAGVITHLPTCFYVIGKLASMVAIPFLGKEAPPFCCYSDAKIPGFKGGYNITLVIRHVGRYGIGMSATALSSLRLQELLHSLRSVIDLEFFINGIVVLFHRAF